MAAARSLLVFGSTGRCGLCVLRSALDQGWTVTAFVRNPARVPDDLRGRVNVHTGDLNDAASVSAAVKAAAPHAVVDASSALPVGQPKGTQANNADRSVVLKSLVRTLDAEGRLDDCVLLVVGGQLVPEPGGTAPSFGVAAMAFCLRLALGRKWTEMQESLDWMWSGAPQGFRFVYARMGYMVEEPSKGSLEAQTTANNMQRGTVSYCEVGDALVRLAGDKTRAWERKGVYFNYRAASQR